MISLEYKLISFLLLAASYAILSAKANVASDTSQGHLYNDNWSSDLIYINVPVNLTQILQSMLPKLIQSLENVMTQQLQRQHKLVMAELDIQRSKLNNISDVQSEMMLMLRRQDEKLDLQQIELEEHRRTMLNELGYLNQSIKVALEPIWEDFEIIQSQHHSIDIKLDLLETQIGEHQKGQDQLSSTLLSHSEDISKSVITATDALLCSLTRDNSLRLADGGRVEIKCGNKWGTVCHNGWSFKDARVVCRQLGLPYSNARSTSHSAFGQGTGPIWFTDVDCTGSENTLWECEHGNWGQNQCGHHMDAGVICR